MSEIDKKIHEAEWKNICEYRRKVDDFSELLKAGEDGHGGYYPANRDEWLEAAGELREGMSVSELALADALKKYNLWEHIAARIIIALLRETAARPAPDEESE
jgi:hypothetical protein